MTTAAARRICLNDRFMENSFEIRSTTHIVTQPPRLLGCSPMEPSAQAAMETEDDASWPDHASQATAGTRSAARVGGPSAPKLSRM